VLNIQSGPYLKNFYWHSFPVLVMPYPFFVLTGASGLIIAHPLTTA
jgi:hypothetical protein